MTQSFGLPGFRPVIFAFLLLLLMVGAATADTLPSFRFIEERNYKSFSRISKSDLMKMGKAQAWRKMVPQVQAVRIESTADGSGQPALFYHSGSDHAKPLLVVLHSWSSDYQKQFSIPYGLWAVRNDWVFIHPDFRGAYTGPQSTASEQSVRDILDAVDYARRNARVDSTRIYVTGFSGGGMMALIMAGRFPELWAGVAAWVPVYDLALWYKVTRRMKRKYANHIANSCGGPPVSGTIAESECRKRSVSTYLRNARGKRVQIYIATGIRDDFVPPGHSFRAFNDLADGKDRISENDILYIDKHLRLPPHMRQKHRDSLFSDAGLRILFQRKSANVVLNIFNGRHDVVYNAGLLWLAGQRR